MSTTYLKILRLTTPYLKLSTDSAVRQVYNPAKFIKSTTGTYLGRNRDRPGLRIA